jgi:hypothetical protein
VDVHYEIYDGIPVIGKWLTVSNGTTRSLGLDRVAVERLALVEAESAVDERPDVAWRTPPITVLSDYMFKGMDIVTGNQVARWTNDPAFDTQVSYALKTPCVLVCEPPIGPGVTLAPGEIFTSFRVLVRPATTPPNANARASPPGAPIAPSPPGAPKTPS